MIQLTKDKNCEGVYLELPASSMELEKAWHGINKFGEEVASAQIVGVISNVWNFERYLKNAEVKNLEQLKTLNRIAEQTDSLNGNQRKLLGGALDASSVNGLDDVIAIGENLEQYLLIPEVTTDRELGIYLVGCGVASFDEHVQRYLDYSKIGIEYYANHGGAYTAAGYVVRRVFCQVIFLEKTVRIPCFHQGIFLALGGHLIRHLCA